eukprot:9378440-Heterocapsa_arctica.AAC.1
MKVNTGRVYSEKGKALREFWSACGPTEACKACADPHGRVHNALCRKRQEEFKKYGKRPASGVEDEPPARRQRIEPTAGAAIP